MSGKNTITYRIRLKERLISVFDDKCAICGYNKCHSALEFHHINPELKNFTISQNTSKGWQTLLEEAKKCVLVCSNCHREIHEGLIDLALLQSNNFNEEKAKQITEEIEHTKHSQQSFCEKCNAQLVTHARYCPKCAAENRRLIKRPSRDELKQLIRTKPFTHISYMYGVSDNAIRRWCAAYDLPSKVKDIKNYSDDEWKLI